MRFLLDITMIQEISCDERRALSGAHTSVDPGTCYLAENFFGYFGFAVLIHRSKISRSMGGCMARLPEPQCGSDCVDLSGSSLKDLARRKYPYCSCAR